MDKFMMDRIKQDTPLVNPDIANGLASKVLPYGVEYIDSVFKSVGRDFPPGLEYVSYRRCNPYEEFMIEPKKKNDRRVVDIAKSSIFLVRFNFRFEGRDLRPVYFYMPADCGAGSVILGGSRFYISPVLSDIVISYEMNGVFVRLLRDKFSVKRENHNLFCDGVRITVPIAWSTIYHVNKDQNREKKVANANTCLVHYLLCRYGFSEMFKRFTTANPVVGGTEITPEVYNPEEWHIFHTYNFGMMKSVRSSMESTNIRVAVRKSEMTELVTSMIAGFYYVVDHFPDRIEPEYVDNTRIWKILMGHLLFGSVHSEGKLHDDIHGHIQSLDEYVDSIMQKKFLAAGFVVTDIYKFFVIAIENISKWLMSAPSKINSLYDKELSILYDVFNPITSSIHNFLFKLKTAAKKGLTDREIEDLMSTHMKSKQIFSLTRSPTGVGSLSYSGDCKFMKITGIMTPQRGAGDGDDMEALYDPARFLHFSFAEVGNYNNLPKKNPTADGRINPHVLIDENGKIIPNPKFDQLREEVSRQIRS